MTQRFERYNYSKDGDTPVYTLRTQAGHQDLFKEGCSLLPDSRCRVPLPQWVTSEVFWKSLYFSHFKELFSFHIKVQISVSP